MKILLAEDDPHVSVVAQICLEKIGGHHVTLVQDGQAALEMALSQSFDLVLLDGMMPQLPGLQVAVQIRDAGVLDLPIIFLSAKSEEKDIAKFLAFGNGFIRKPFDPQTLCAEIDSLLLAGRVQAA